MLGKMSGVDPKLLKKDYGTSKKKKLKKIFEYKGTKAEEVYSSKGAMKKHEAKEGKKEEKREEKLSKFKKR